MFNLSNISINLLSLNIHTTKHFDSMTFLDVKNTLHILPKTFSLSLAPFLLVFLVKLSVEAEPDLKKYYISAASFEKFHFTSNVTIGQQLCVCFGGKG